MGKMGQKIFFLLVMIVPLIFFARQGLAENPDCSCPEVTCGPCQKKVSIGKEVRFCSWGEINVCRKVVCENVHYYFGCLTQMKKGNQKKNANQKGATSKDEELVLPYEIGKKSEKKKSKDRSLASVKKRGKGDLKGQGLIEVENDSRVINETVYSDKVVGNVTALKGSLEIFHRGQIRRVKNGDRLYVGDEIFNRQDKEQKVTIQFENGKVSFQMPVKSKWVLQDPYSMVGRFQPFAHLIYGALEVTTDLQEGGFDILAGQMLVRLKEGSAHVTYEMVHGNLTVKAEALKGNLEVTHAKDLSGEKIPVQEGRFISWMSETPAHLFNSDEKLALAGEGFLTPVFEMSRKQKEKLGLIKEEPKMMFADWSKQSAGRSPASAGDSLCQSPSAQYQQCAWTCEGGKAGQSICDASKAGVHCVRRMCNAAGQWGPATPFASSYSDLCPAQGTRVGDCTP
ncbi:MAG: hypothetical protein KDD33_13390 [Bdellovibrionales bacterium]|nr:hypothetical protein [Bdellovibrionales bacterium]